jgi:IS5 family transposase
MCLQKSVAFADAGYQGAARRPDDGLGVNWRIALRPGKRRALDKGNEIDMVVDQIEKPKASVRAEVEHPFRVNKRQIGHVRVRYRGLKNNTVQLIMLFTLCNLWMARERLLAAQS